MSKKKQFVRPMVLQDVQVQLEVDLLRGSVQNVMKVTSMGIDVDNYDFSEEIDQNPYTVEWD